MRNKILVFILIFILMVITLQAEKAGTLSDVLKPETMSFSKDSIFIVEKAEFLKFSLKDLKLLNRFGKKGEGPGELSVIPGINNNIVPLADKIFVEGLKKMMFLSPKGELIKEMRKKMQTWKTLPIGDHFAMMRVRPGKDGKGVYFALSLFDNKLEEIKDIYRIAYDERDKEIPMAGDAIHFAVYKDRLYVEKSAEGFVIDVYDSNGNLLHHINKKMAPLKYTQKHFEQEMKQLENDDLIRMMAKRDGGWDSFIKNIKFNKPEHLPLIQDLTVQDGKIYVLTFEAEEGKEKHIVMDLQGNVLQTLYLPMPKKAGYVNRVMGRDNRFYGYCGDKYYYLQENEENEEWELHVARLK